MIKLRKNTETKNYKGFFLKEGFWYGVDTETHKEVVTSGWECNGAVAIYFLESDNTWKMMWIDLEEVEVEYSRKDILENKMSFAEWLETEKSISWSYFDDNYHGTMAEQIVEEYQTYYFDGLPKFAHEYVG